MTTEKPKKDLPGSAASSSCGTEKASDSAHFSQQELRKLSFEVSARWFNSELAPRLTLSVVNPWRIHAYWTINKSMMKEALANTKAPHVLVLRFTDLTPLPAGSSAEAESFDVEVDGLDNNWYIDLWQPGKHYLAELGLRGDETFHLFVRSNKIQVPRAEPSPVLEFKQAQYQRAKSASDGKPAYSVAHLTDRLPPFNSFPDVRADLAELTLSEPEFPGAPLMRVTAEVDEGGLGDQTISSRERIHYGTDFPQITVEESDLTLTTHDSDTPKLPATDPLTISPSKLELEPSPLPEFSALSDTPNPSKPEQHASAKDFIFPQIDIAELAVVHHQREYIEASHASVMAPGLDTLLTDESMPELEFSESDASASGSGGNYQSQANEWVAPKPVLALEDALAESYFSATHGDDRELSVSVALELSGTSGTDQLVTLFGEPVDLDEQGRFSVRLKLDKGPALAALVRAHRQRSQEGN